MTEFFSVRVFLIEIRVFKYIEAMFPVSFLGAMKNIQSSIFGIVPQGFINSIQVQILKIFPLYALAIGIKELNKILHQRASSRAEAIQTVLIILSIQIPYLL